MYRRGQKTCYRVRKRGAFAFSFVRGPRTGGAPVFEEFALKYNDIYTETPAHADTLSHLGPLAPLAGKWYGEDGVDTHPEAEGPVAEPYHETWTFEVIDAQNNGPQVFYGLRYHVYITKPGELNAFHDQVGYLLWEPETKKIYMTLAIPRGQIAMAEGTAEPGAKTFTLRAERGNLVNGICSNPFLEEAFNTKSWEIQFRFNPDGTFDYEQVTVLVIPGVGEFEHTDTNHMHMIEAPRPNPAMIMEGLLNRNPQ